MTRDPVGFEADELNLYRYVSGNPVIMVDADGLADHYAAGGYEGPTIGAAPPWYNRWYYDFWGSLKDCDKPFVTDPRETGEDGMASWIGGNLYHRTPFGDFLETGVRLVHNPFGETKARLGDIGSFLVGLPNLPENWNQLPDHKKQDIGINVLLGLALGKPAYRYLCVPNKVTGAGKLARQFLGPNYRTFTNRAGDLSFLSNNGKRRIRFDFNRPHPHRNRNPHINIDEYINGDWVKGPPIYPRDVTPE